VGVEADLFGRHGFALRHDHATAGGKLEAGVHAELADDLAGLAGVVRKMHHAADGGKSLGELLEELGEAIEVGLAPALQLGLAGFEVEALEREVAASAQPGHGVNQRLLQILVAESPVDAPREARAALFQSGALARAW